MKAGDSKEEKSDDGDKKADKQDEQRRNLKLWLENKGSGEKMNVTVPQLPESVSDATISAWHVKEGDEVKRDQNLVDIETDKVVLEVVAPADGVLVKIEHDEGATVGADDVIGIVEAGASSGGSASKSDDSKSESSAESKDDGGDSEVAGPAVRRLLGEHGLKPSDVKGTGKGGRVTKEDVEKHVKRLIG